MSDHDVKDILNLEIVLDNLNGSSKEPWAQPLKEDSMINLERHGRSNTRAEGGEP